MKTKIMLFIGFVVFCCSFLAGCMASKNNTEKTVPYKVAERYFVRNDIAGLPPTVITTPEEFEKNFGMATAMGPDGQPTEIDFKKSFIICITVAPTDIDTELSVISLTKTKSNQLNLKYKIKHGAKLTYTKQPLVLLVVDKKYELPVKTEAS